MINTVSEFTNSKMEHVIKDIGHMVKEMVWVSSKNTRTQHSSMASGRMEGNQNGLAKIRLIKSSMAK